MKLAPIAPSNGFSIPEGVLRLGATYGVNKDSLIYKYEDGVPGDYPNPQEVFDFMKTNS